MNSDKYRDLANHLRHSHGDAKILCCPIETCRKTCISLHQLVYHSLWDHNKPWFQAADENPGSTDDPQADSQSRGEAIVECRCNPTNYRSPLQQLVHKRILSPEIQRIEHTVEPLVTTARSIIHRYPRYPIHTNGRLKRIREYEVAICSQLPQELELLVPYLEDWW